MPVSRAIIWSMSSLVYPREMNELLTRLNQSMSEAWNRSLPRHARQRQECAPQVQIYRWERAQGRPVSEAGRVNLRVPHFDKVVLISVQQVLVRLRPQQVRIVGGVGLLVLALVRVAFDMPVVAELIEYVEAALLLEERARARFLEPARSRNRCFGCEAPCATIQKHRRNPIHIGKRGGRLNAPGGAGQARLNLCAQHLPLLRERDLHALCEPRRVVIVHLGSAGSERGSVGRSRRGRQGNK